MNQENKYYTPDISEFHIGFEYEWFDDETKKWVKEPTPEEISLEDYQGQESWYRVKYLDREDIESLGFRYCGSDKDGKSFENYSKEEWYLHHYNYHPEEEVDLQVRIFHQTPKYSHKTFNGIIKNKSELERILKQLGI